MQYIWSVVGGPILVGTSCNHTTFEHALFGVWWGPHFSGNLVQSYIRTCIIWFVVGAPILVETSCNHTFKHALFGVWWGPPFYWKPHAIIHSNMHCLVYSVCGGAPILVGTSCNHTSNMHYLVCGGGPHFSGNLMQSYYIRTCIIWCVVGAPVLVGTSCNHTFEHALFGVWWGPPVLV